MRFLLLIITLTVALVLSACGGKPAPLAPVITPPKQNSTQDPTPEPDVQAQKRVLAAYDLAQRYFFQNTNYAKFLPDIGEKKLLPGDMTTALYIVRSVRNVDLVVDSAGRSVIYGLKDRINTDNEMALAARSLSGLVFFVTKGEVDDNIQKKRYDPATNRARAGW